MKDATITPLLPREQRDQITRLLAGDSDTVAEVRSWIRGASSPYRRRLAADLEDMEQQILIELLTLLREHRFRGESSLATYVRRMVHYKCLNIVRHRRGREWVDVENADLEAKCPSPFDRARSRSSIDMALQVLAEMSEACRELWRMIHDDLSYQEMSTKMGVAAGALRVRVLRCRKKALRLRDKLENDE